MMKPHAHSRGLSELNEKLRRESRKVTGPRQAILDVLRKHPQPLTNKQIFSALPAGECDLATVYRSMHLLEEMGMVQRFDFGDGTARWELVCDQCTGHHHHLICTGCSRVVEVADCFPVDLEEKIAAQNGFKAVTHKLEFFGVCPQCQK